MSEQQPKEYIITEEMLQSAIKMDKSPYDMSEQLEYLLRSRPHPAPQGPEGFIPLSFMAVNCNRLFTPSDVCVLIEKHRAEAARQAREKEIYTTLEVVRNTLDRYEDNEDGTIEDALGDIRNHLEGSLILIQEESESPRSKPGEQEQPR